MAQFRYHGFDARGLSVAGEIAANSEAEAASLLRKKGIAVDGLGKSRVTDVTQPAMTLETARLLEDLSLLLEAGYTYPKAVSYLAGNGTGKLRRHALQDVMTLLSEGMSFARCLERTGLVGGSHAAMLDIAEHLNRTTQTLSGISSDIRSRLAFRASIRKALAYPAFLLCAVMVVIAIFLFLIFPTIEGIYKDSGMELPLVFVIIDVARSVGRTMLVLLAFTPLLLAKGIRSRVLKTLSRGVGHVPIAAALHQLAAMRNFLAVLEIAIGSGASVKSAFQSARSVVDSNDGLYADISEKIMRGQDVATLRPALKSLEIPLNLIDVGLRTNRLAPCLGQAKAHVEEEISKRTELLTAIAGPAATEPPRLCRRPQLVRSRVYDKQNDEQIFS